MHLHEYQAKNLLEKYLIPTTAYAVVSSEEDAIHAIERLHLTEAVIKIQIHAGGRGKAGGVKFAKNKEEILKSCKELLGKRFFNNQTGPSGLVAQKVLITPPIKIKKEYYLSAIIDRTKGRPTIIASKEGGGEIEEIAQKNPKGILKEPIGLNGRIRHFQLFYLAKQLGWEKEIKQQGMHIISQLCRLFSDTDASLFEINPLVETEEGKLIALDAKCTIDDNALFRQPELQKLYDSSQHTHNEVLAEEYGLSYVGLDGNIGCMVNGAGLAMATMDILYHYKGKPANFLDVGGSASLEKITQGYKILLRDRNIKAIFVNIFGGIMDCALIAEGIVQATKEEKSNIAVIVRLEGTNEKKGKEILASSQLPFTIVKTMAEGAQKACELILDTQSK